MGIAPPEPREYVPTSSGATPILAAPTCRHMDLMAAMMLDILMERSPLLEGKSLMGGGGIISPVAQAEEYVDALLAWAGCVGLKTEVGNGLTTDGILLIAKSEDNLGGLAEMIGGGVPGEELVPDEEHEVNKGPELDRPAVVGALRVFTRLETCAFTD